MSDDRKFCKSKDGNNGLAKNFDVLARPIVTVDVDKYKSWIEDSGLSDAEKTEFLQALWSIVVTFVELGFGVHPLQEVCGQNSDRFSLRPKEAFNQVRLNDFNDINKDRDSSPLGGLEIK